MGLNFNYKIDGDNFAMAGEASSDVKRTLKKLGLDAEIIRRVAICMYEGEINMVIHAGGGEAFLYLNEDTAKIVLEDSGPGISDIEMAMTEGYSTANETVRNLGFGAGMGLPNMKRYADKISVESTEGSGTKVTIIIKIR